MRKHIEEKNENFQKLLQEIFKMMKGGGIYKAIDDGEDFVILEFHNSPDEEKFNEPSQNPVGKRFLDVYPDGPAHGLLNVFKRVWATGIPENYPITVYDGEEISAWRSNYVFRLSPDEIVAFTDDITKRKQLEKDLLENEYLFRSIFETSPCPINLNRLEDGKFILINQKFLELTGYRENEVIGRTAADINIWNDLDKRNEFFTRLLDAWQINDFEAEFRCKDGKILTALVSARLLSFRNKQHLLAVTNDISELKKVQHNLSATLQELEKRYFVSTEKLQESQVKYSSLVEALLTGVYMCEDGKINFVNTQFAQMFSYRKEELLGKDILDLILPEDREKYGSFSGDTSENTAYEIRGISKHGDIICLFGKNKVFNVNEQHISIGNFADITTLKKAEKKRQKAEDELHRLSSQLLSAEERERKRIASDIHDSVGQSLSAIKYSVESALASINDHSIAAAREVLENVIPLTQQSIEEVRRLIMDLRPSMLDDLGLISTISWFCREFGSVYNNIKIKKDIQVDEADVPMPLKIVIYRIVQEALNNAAKYSRAEHIFLRLAKSERFLELQIKDNGVGFDIHRVTESNEAPRGIGLASMKERTKLSGGSFKILSAPGTGTRVEAKWPFVHAG